MQDIPKMPPLQPVFTAARPTPYEQMLLTLAQAESLLYLAAAQCSALQCGIRHELGDKITDAATSVMETLAFARNPPEPTPDDDPKHSQNEEWYMEQAREGGAL